MKYKISYKVCLNFYIFRDFIFKNKLDIDLFTNYLSDIKDRVLSEPIKLFTNCTDVDEVLFYNNKIHIHFNINVHTKL